VTYARHLGYGGRPLEGLSMLKIDPAFLFELASAMRRVQHVTKDTATGNGYFFLDSARTHIRQAVDESIYAHALRAPVRAAANSLLAHIDNMLAPFQSVEEWPDTFAFGDVMILHKLYSNFELLFIADLQSTAVYLVLPHGGYDTGLMMESGESLFSRDLPHKVPAAMPDLQEACRCIAFELPTAAGFHLHRAHESVLRVYWDCVTGGEDRPEENNMGVYLRELDKREKGKKAVRSHLRSIKDFHRNPLMHPEQSLEDVDQALDLLAAIRCSIGYMLQEIPSDAPLLEQMEAPVPIVQTEASAAE
jgi:hypothetical protein